MAIDYTALGQRIADFRSKENLSQEELAFRCGVGNKHISNIELGKSKPSLESLVQIANFLNVSADDLLVDWHIRLPLPIPRFTVCFWTATHWSRRFLPEW